MSEETFNFFDNKEDALEQVSSSLRLCQLLAERHGFPFLAVYQPNEDFMTTFKHFPGSTGSELKAAWYEISPGKET